MKPINIGLLFVLLGADLILCKPVEEVTKKKITDKVVIVYDDSRDDENGKIVDGQDVLRGIEAGRQSQTRFDFIDKKGMSKETWAGVRDLSLGKKGKPIIRFDTGANTGHGNHINFDPRGYPSSKNLHIPLVRGSTAVAAAGQATIQYGMRGLAIVNTATNVLGMVAAMDQDFSDNLKKKESIEKLEAVIWEIHDELRYNGNLNHDERNQLVQLLDKCSQYLDQLKRYQSVPENTIRTGASIAGGTSAGYMAGSLCAATGAKMGAAVGWIFGPLMPLFTISGGLIGAFGCGAVGAMVRSAAGKKIANTSMEVVVGEKVDFKVKVID